MYVHLQGQINTSLFRNVSSTFGYQLNKNLEEIRIDPFTMIPTCEYIEQANRATNMGGKTIEWCSLFQPVITDQGMCQGFNSHSVNKIFQPSAFLTALDYAYKDDILDMNQLFKAHSNSEETGLNFILDRQTLFRNFWRDSSRLTKGSFKVSVSPQLSVMSAKSGQRTIPLGMHTHTYNACCYAK